jgi:hypothetical protein
MPQMVRATCASAHHRVGDAVLDNLRAATALA